MEKLKVGSPSPAMVLAAIALSFAIAGTAVAGTDAVSGKITKSKVKKVAKKQADKELRANVSGSHVNLADSATNATNAANAENANNANNANNLGGKSAADVVRWASINSNGTLASGSGLASAGGGAGEYFVTATEPIENCAAVVTMRSGNGSSAVALSGIGPGHTVDPNSFNFHRVNSANTSEDGPFNVAVFC